MTSKEMHEILLYHNKKGFEKDLKLLLARIDDLEKTGVILSCTPYKLAVSSNRDNISPVESVIMTRYTIEQLKTQANELKRFIERLDWSIDSLPTLEKMVIKSRFFNEDNTAKKFRFVAAETGYTMDWCHVQSLQGMKRLCEMLDSF